MNQKETLNDEITKYSDSSLLTNNHSNTLTQGTCRKRRQLQSMRRTAMLDEDISMQDLKYFT